MPLLINFWPCQRNLIKKTFQNVANTPLLTKIAWTIFFGYFQLKWLDSQKSLFGDIQSQFSMSRIIKNLLIYFFIGQYQFRRPTFVKHIPLVKHNLFLKSRLQMVTFVSLITSTENLIFVTSGVLLASFWKVLIKFHWHGQKFTSCCRVRISIVVSMIRRP